MSESSRVENLKGVQVFEQHTYSDSRGFLKVISDSALLERFGVPSYFYQSNYVESNKNVLRGLHRQNIAGQGKLLSCLSGLIYDVIVDIDPYSPTFKKHMITEMSPKRNQQIWIPPMYLHGYCVLSKNSKILFQCTQKYLPDLVCGVCWNDPDLDISWPLKQPLMSDADKNLPKLKKLLSK